MVSIITCRFIRSHRNGLTVARSLSSLFSFQVMCSFVSRLNSGSLFFERRELCAWPGKTNARQLQALRLCCCAKPLRVDIDRSLPSLRSFLHKLSTAATGPQFLRHLPHLCPPYTKGSVCSDTSGTRCLYNRSTTPAFLAKLGAQPTGQPR